MVTIDAGGQEMAIGRVLSRGFGAVGAAPALFFGVSLALVAVPASLSQLVLRPRMAMQLAPGANPIGQLLPLILVGSVVWLLFYMLAQAVLLRAGVAEIDRRPEAPGAYVSAGIGKVLPLIGLAILLSIAVWIGSILFLAPGIMLAIMWSVAAPALVAEPIGVFAAFGRSRFLTKGARWRIFGLVLLVFAIYFVAAFALGLGTAATRGVGGQIAVQAGPTVASVILSIALQTVFVVIWTAIQAALYVELRDWKDGPAGERLADIFA